VTAQPKPAIIAPPPTLGTTCLPIWGRCGRFFAHYRQCRGEIMIGPPGLPKFGRRVFSFAAATRTRRRHQRHAWKWLAGLYVAGVLAHFSHHMVAVPPAPGDPAFIEALASAPLSLAWPADLIGTLIARS
jgi:hypothetical protein